MKTRPKLLDYLRHYRSALTNGGITMALWLRLLVVSTALLFLMGAMNGIHGSLVGRISSKIAGLLFLLSLVALVWIGFLGLVKWMENRGASR